MSGVGYVATSVLVGLATSIVVLQLGINNGVHAGVCHYRPGMLRRVVERWGEGCRKVGVLGGYSFTTTYNL